MSLGTEIGLGPGDIVLDGDPAPPKGAQLPIFGPCLLWPNGHPSQLLLGSFFVQSEKPSPYNMNAQNNADKTVLVL